MPRKAPIDAPGALHHIICRGIERRKIFRNDAGKEDFVARLSRVLTETQTPCYAWALLSNTCIFCFEPEMLLLQPLCESF